jgi:hypothetical protein
VCASPTSTGFAVAPRSVACIERANPTPTMLLPAVRRDASESWSAALMSWSIPIALPERLSTALALWEWFMSWDAAADQQLLAQTLAGVLMIAVTDDAFRDVPKNV